MGPVPSLVLYSSIILVGALGGALVPLRLKGAQRLSSLLAFAGGVMFGAAFFHMLPEAFHEGGIAVFSYAPAGFALLLLLERYVLTHACEEPPDCEEHAGHGTLGLAAFLGLSVHTLFDGVALGSAVREGIGALAMVAIVAHKIPSSLSLAAILKSEGRRDGQVLGLIVVFALMVPAGAALYLGLDAVAHLETLAPKALAFSAGTFLYVAVSDLLPQLSRHGRTRGPRPLWAMLVGLGSMFLLTFARHGH